MSNGAEFLVVARECLKHYYEMGRLAAKRMMMTKVQWFKVRSKTD